MKKKFTLFLFLLLMSCPPLLNAQEIYKVKVSAQTKEERSLIANLIPIDKIQNDFMESYLNQDDLKSLQKQLPYTILQVSRASNLKIHDLFDFPQSHNGYHNYEATLKKIDELTNLHPTLAYPLEIGSTFENRPIKGIKITASQDPKDTPAFLIMGLHHAREHLTVEMALLFAEYLLNNYEGDPKVKELLQSRIVYIIPTINPDGENYDLKDNNFQYWRKNRSLNADGKNYGVDLNRNYGYKWGTGGSSSSPSSDVYKGPWAFSEPETKAIKQFIESHPEIKMMLTLHSYSELILYPWGHKYEGIGGEDQLVFEQMAKKMASWNHYKAKQSSELYITSGDTCDWAWGERKIFCFTFELSPSDNDYFSGGFYPKPSLIRPSFEANLPAMIYMLDKTKNPYSVLSSL